MPKKIVIVTTGQPSTNPRMVKEYKYFKKEGYNVKVVYAYWTRWAAETDETLFEKKGLSREDFILAGGSPTKEKFKYYFSKILHKFYKKASLYSSHFYKYAVARPAFFLQQTAIREKGDLYIGHNMGALAAIFNNSKARKIAAFFDVEDYYSGQIKDKNSIDFKICINLENAYFKKCDAVFFSSINIAKAYKRRFPSIPSAVIHNVIEEQQVLKSLPHLDIYPLKLVWFSQQIGAERGIEYVVEGLNRLNDLQIELHLLGNCSIEYKNSLKKLRIESSRLFFYNPIPANQIVHFLSDKHLGLATETARDDNNDLALSNKLFTYLAAGNGLVVSDTSAQKQFLDNNKEVGFVYVKNDVDSFCSLIHELYHSPNRILNARVKALELASEKLNWDVESEKFRAVIKEQLSAVV